MISTTPKEITENILKLCEMIGCARDPLFVNVSPEPWCRINECFPNIATKIIRDGGAIQHGWAIWEIPGKLVEGEFHGVWVNPKNDFIDITPKADGETRILFLPDDKRVYKKEPVDNVRMALSNDPMIKELTHFLQVRINSVLSRS